MFFMFSGERRVKASRLFRLLIEPLDHCQPIMCHVSLLWCTGMSFASQRIPTNVTIQQFRERNRGGMGAGQRQTQYRTSNSESHRSLSQSRAGSCRSVRAEPGFQRSAGKSSRSMKRHEDVNKRRGNQQANQRATQRASVPRTRAARLANRPLQAVPIPQSLIRRRARRLGHDDGRLVPQMPEPNPTGLHCSHVFACRIRQLREVA